MELGMARVVARVDELGEPAPRTFPAPPRPADSSPLQAMRREGDYWTVQTARGVFHVRDRKGMRHLEVLLSAPGRERHVLELAAAAAGTQAPAVGERAWDVEGHGMTTGFGDAGAVLDEQAKAQYRQRLDELDGLIEEARARGVDVTADQYPYTAGSTSLYAVVQNGAFRSDSPGGIGSVSGADVLIAAAPKHGEWEGQRLDELAQTWGVDVKDAADRIIEELTDLSLLGNVLADRYLSATYISRPKELSDWLHRYGDTADAHAIYRLAVLKGDSNPTEPTANVVHIGSPDESYDDRDAHWLAGLEAWRRGSFTKAAQAFAKDAEDEDKNRWEQSKSAFWAARAYLRAKQPDKVSAYLRKAAKYPLTFYGQLAARALGVETVFTRPGLGKMLVDAIGPGRARAERGRNQRPFGGGGGAQAGDDSAGRSRA